MSVELLRLAEAFIDAGGRVSWTEWIALDDAQRAALVLAGRRHAMQLAVAAGRAAASAEEAKAILSETANREELEDVAMAAGHQAIHGGPR